MYTADSKGERLATPSATRSSENSAWAERSAWIGIAGISAFFLATSVYIAAHRLFWFDELFTVMYAGLPNAHAVSDALAHADNQMPVPYYLLMWVVDRLFSNTEIAARIPSALAMTAGLILVFDCVRRLTDGLAGLTAAAFLTCSFLPYYGYEARSYAIYFMFAALSLWLWNQTSWDRRITAACFGATLFAAILVHYYAVLLIVPYALWELIHGKPWRHPSANLVGGVAGTGCAALLLLSQIRGAAGHSATFWSKPSLFALQKSYADLFPEGLFLLAVVMIWVVVMQARSAPRSIPAMRPAESIGWLFLAIPIAGFVLGELITNAFVTRYFIGALPGVALAFSCLVWRHFSAARLTRLGIFGLLIAVGSYGQLQVARHPESIDPYGQQTQTRAMLRMENALNRDGKKYFLVGGTMLFMEANYYSRTPGAYALLIASAEDREVPTVRLLTVVGRYYPYRFWNLEELKQHAHETALIEPSPALLEKIHNAGIRTVVHGEKPLQAIYLE
jgi:hypothetical protein